MQGNSKRIPHLDFLRGIAVLGLLLMNAPSMGQLEYFYVPFSPELTSDNIVRTLNILFFDGRFRSLFCLLLGIGIYLQVQSYRQKGLDHAKIVKSRMWWLLLIGLIHCLFIWSGDILMMYALVGFCLLIHIDDSAEKLIRRGVIYFSIGMIVAAILIYEVNQEPITRDSEQYKNAVLASTQGYLADFGKNLSNAIVMIITFPIFSLFWFGGVTYIGLGLFKSGQLTKGFSKITVCWLLIVTISVSTFEAYLASYHYDLWRYIPSVLASLSGLTMALLIWHIVLKINIANSQGHLVTAIKNVGSMALSFYIFQSLVVTLLLQVFFPEWNYSFSLLNFFSLSIAVISIQLLIGYFYKKQFKQGPLEYLWRSLVNRRIAKLQEAQANLESS